MADDKTSRGIVKTRQMGWADTFAVVAAVAVTREESIITNPVTKYINRTPDENTSWWHKLLFRLFMYPSWYSMIRQRLVWGVNDVDSVLVWGFPESYPPIPRSPLGKLTDAALARINKFGARITRSPVQDKRLKDFLRKMQAGVKHSIGERAKEMLCVESILTRSDKRGRGYASALVRVMADQADREGRAMWVGNSDVDVNTPFWESLGFVAVHDVVVGEDDPTWHDGPVHTLIMVREPVAKGKL